MTENEKWYNSRPQVIKDAIDLLPHDKMYSIKPYGKQCYILSYDEPDSGKLEDVTVTVQKTGVGGHFENSLLAILDMNQVFGLKLTDLEPWKEETI